MSSRKIPDRAIEEVAPLRYAQTKQIFRQARHSNDLIPVEVQIAGLTARARNWSRTGIGFETPHLIPELVVGKKVEDVKVSCHGFLLYEGSLEIRSHLSSEKSKVIYGASFASHLLCVD